MQIIKALIAMHTEGQNSIHGYQFQRAREGYNGAVYSAINESGEKLAVKIARKTPRKRAWREYTTTRLLHDLAIQDISPKALDLILDVPELNGDVVISTWLEGENLVVPPAPDEQAKWLAILQTLSSVHSISPAMTDLELPLASAPAQHPIELLAVIQERFAELPEGQLGLFDYATIKAAFNRLENSVPKYWDETPALRLNHSDCHSANMLTYENRIYLVDWENSGWADPALDIANMGSNWRFFHLSEEHQNWLRETYAEMRQDPSLVRRAQVYAVLSDMMWLIMYSRMLRQREENPQLTMKDTPEFQREMQQKYFERIHARIDLI